MQAIVADTTPLNYLVLIQATDILPELYRTVLIPPAVKAELAHANTPAVVRAWISQPPAWLEVVSLKRPVDSALEHLDAGEREAISLASELQGILLLMDERDGVTIARHRGLRWWVRSQRWTLLQPVDSLICKPCSTGCARPRSGHRFASW